MMSNVLRDSEALPVGGGFIALQRGFADALGRGWEASGRQRVRLEAVLRLAVSFHTWRSLVRAMGLTHDEAIELIARWTGSLHETAATTGQR
jgi:hypothetical protein